MTRSPFQLSRPPRAVPIPDVDSPRPRQAPQEAPSSGVRAPAVPVDLDAALTPGIWTFRYRGTSGAEGSVGEFPDAIELPAPTPLVVHFDVDTSLRGEPRIEPPDTIVQPNAIVRARVKFDAGKAEDIEFECDWWGSIPLVAKRVELRRVSVRADATLPYEPQPLDLSAIAIAYGPLPITTPTLTEPPLPVAVNASRILVLPRFARRLSLLPVYGNEGSPGDAPLGQLFVAFQSASNTGIAYIDAMSAREALFGVGLPIPAGTRAVALSNRSADASIQLGAVWHLGGF